MVHGRRRAGLRAALQEPAARTAAPELLSGSGRAAQQRFPPAQPACDVKSVTFGRMAKRAQRQVARAAVDVETPATPPAERERM